MLPFPIYQYLLFQSTGILSRKYKSSASSHVSVIFFNNCDWDHSIFIDTHIYAEIMPVKCIVNIIFQISINVWPAYDSWKSCIWPLVDNIVTIFIMLTNTLWPIYHQYDPVVPISSIGFLVQCIVIFFHTSLKLRAMVEEHG